MARPRAFKFVGDSHSARCDGLVFTDSDDPARFIITQAHNHYGFRCSEFTSADGTLNYRLARSLLTLNFIRGTRHDAVPELGRFRTAEAPLGTEFGLRLRQHYRDEPLIVSCGEVDARDVIARLPLDARIDLPVPVPQFGGGEPSAPRISFEDLAADIEAEYLAPFYRGMRTLSAIGIRQLFLMAIPPPGIDDGEFEAHCGFTSRAHVRYGVHQAMNMLLARFCREAGIGFVDMWPIVVGPGGTLDPRFHSDGIHLNRAAAIEIVAYIDRLVGEQTVPELDPLI